MDYRNRVIGLEYIHSRDLDNHPGNWRDHPKPQVEALRGVLSEVGVAGALLAYRSERNGGKMTTIDGHLRKDAAPQTWPVLVLDVTDAEADYILATHDPLAAMAQADAAALDALLASVNSGDAAVQALLAELAEDAGLYTPSENEPYTREIKSPVYIPTGEKPKTSELFDRSRTEQLMGAIDRAQGITEEEKDFLRIAAQRHTVMNYRNIAEYYAHAGVELQGLMEDSALVIIDFGKAIELGYVNLAEEIGKQYGIDYGDDK